MNNTELKIVSKVLSYDNDHERSKFFQSLSYNDLIIVTNTMQKYHDRMVLLHVDEVDDTKLARKIINNIINS